MRVILFGATGMVGQGVLRECLLDPGVEQVLSIGRRAPSQRDPKLQQIVRENLFDYSDIASEIDGFDACFFCLGVASLGMSEQAYKAITRDIAVAAAGTLVKANPAMTFIFVSGQGADSTGRSKLMWARVKGETENLIRALPFHAVYAFRPGFIQPLHGITSRTRLYRTLYAIMAGFTPLIQSLSPKLITTTEKIGLAMIQIARHGFPKPILDNSDINSAAVPKIADSPA